MWALQNQTPFEANRTWVRDKNGAHHWIVVVKATYDLLPGGALEVSKEPLEPLQVPEYIGADGQSSLRYDADLIAMKPATDVYLNAVAYAPNGRPVPRVEVGFRVGGLRKDLVVFGDRTWSRAVGGVVPSAASPFSVMPITYERAFGGTSQNSSDPRDHRMDFRNPIGTGIAERESDLVGRPAPQVEDSQQKMGKGSPAGFGAIASYWSPRKELAGTFDAKWAAERRPLLPLDYDPKWLLCAPADQQMAGYLTGGEPVELTNLVPTGQVRFAVPKLSFSFDTYFGARRKSHTGQLVTIIIESDKPRLILTWQTSLPCGTDAEYLDRTVIRSAGHAS
jgi:hypothetical protein